MDSFQVRHTLSYLRIMFLYLLSSSKCKLFRQITIGVGYVVQLPVEVMAVRTIAGHAGHARD